MMRTDGNNETIHRSRRHIKPDVAFEDYFGAMMARIKCSSTMKRKDGRSFKRILKKKQSSCRVRHQKPQRTVRIGQVRFEGEEAMDVTERTNQKTYSKDTHAIVLEMLNL